MAIELSRKAYLLVALAVTAGCAGAPLQKPVGRGGYLGAGLCPHEGGLEIVSVKAGSPAAKAGLKSGDVLTHYGGAPLAEPAARKALLWDIR